MCKTQAQSKSDKAGFLGFMDKLFEAKLPEEKMNCKHFKVHYASKPTKRYLRLLRKIEKAEAMGTGGGGGVVESMTFNATD